MPMKKKAARISAAKKVVGKVDPDKLPYNPVFATVRNPEDKHDLNHAKLMPALMATPLPAEFTLFDKALGITNQDYGSCVGASHTKEAEYQNKRETGKVVALDYRWLYAMCKRLDGNPSSEGTYPRMAAQVRVDFGVLPAGILKTPYKNHGEFITLPEDQEEAFNALAFEFRSTGFVTAPSVAEIKNVLVTQNTPVTITVPVYENYLKPDANDVIGKPVGKMIGSHRIQVVGYSDSKGKFLIQNSWGKNFGDNGTAWYDYNFEIYDGMADVDYVNGQVTSGAPVDLAWPVDKPFVIQKFGEDFIEIVNGVQRWYYKSRGLNGHPGLDLRQSDGQGREGDPVYAADAGTVIFAAFRNVELGNTVIIKHPWGTTHYNHLQAGLVRVGQDVGKREQIGKLGKTGRVTGPHVHFAGTINGVSNPGYGNMVDLLPYIKTTAATPAAGIAKVPGSTLQVMYQKIGVPIQPDAKGIAAVQGDDMIAYAKDKKTAMYIHKIPGLVEKDQIKKGFKLGDMEPNIDEI